MCMRCRTLRCACSAPPPDRLWQLKQQRLARWLLGAWGHLHACQRNALASRAQLCCAWAAPSPPWQR
eukprot:8218867-Lingulodinium_polyedra.AAC.1